MFNLQIFSDLYKNLENIFRCLKCVHFNKEKAKISKKYLKDGTRCLAFRDL